jgi:hypothetical protein
LTSVVFSSLQSYETEMNLSHPVVLDGVLARNQNGTATDDFFSGSTKTFIISSSTVLGVLCLVTILVSWAKRRKDLSAQPACNHVAIDLDRMQMPSRCEVMLQADLAPQCAQVSEPDLCKMYDVSSGRVAYDEHAFSDVDSDGRPIPGFVGKPAKSCDSS